MTRISCVSTRPKRKPGTKTEDPDVREVVRMLMRSFSDKEPLLKTLNKYVRIVRTEHCFLLFEELGKSDEWLQCLEVSSFFNLCIFSFWVFEIVEIVVVVFVVVDILYD